MISSPNSTEDEIDAELFRCVQPISLQSFFLFAGAGSGKTRSLVTLLRKIKEQREEEYLNSNKKVCVITYTNAATEEIIRRIGDASIFSISTIHSFIWNLIQYYQSDIKAELTKSITKKLAILEKKEKEKKKLAATDTKNKEKYSARLAKINEISRFNYNPNGDNPGRDSLQHAEVIQIGANLIKEKPLLQKILVSRYPILLIDESQDTNKNLIDAFFELEENQPDIFVLGLIGDTKQRIYLDGKEDLGSNLPENWAQPNKTINYRSAKRIIELTNKIAQPMKDSMTQVAHEDADDGYVRLFIVDSSQSAKKSEVESTIRSEMATITGDRSWIPNTDELSNPSVKTLILEHRMAANRLGFLELFGPLYSAAKTKNQVLKGEGSEIQFFTNYIIPIYMASREENGNFAIAELVRLKSPLLSKNHLSKELNQKESLKKAHDAVLSLISIWEKSDPALVAIIELVRESGLFPLPEAFNSISSGMEVEEDNPWYAVKDVKLSQFLAYSEYIQGNSEFDTHQGVKGLEFERVMVIIDDSEAKGYTFSYEKLFKTQDPTAADKTNISKGKETSIDKTSRLLYVTCTRAKKSLAIVAYTASPEQLKRNLMSNDWFNENEIILV